LGLGRFILWERANGIIWTQVQLALVERWSGHSVNKLKEAALYDYKERSRYISCCVIVCCMHEVHVIDAYMADHVGLSALFRSRIGGRIWMKFGMDIMPLGSLLKSYF
jgi:hypothetical protein